MGHRGSENDDSGLRISFAHRPSPPQGAARTRGRAGAAAQNGMANVVELEVHRYWGQGTALWMDGFRFIAETSDSGSGAPLKGRANGSLPSPFRAFPKPRSAARADAKWR